MKLKVIISGGGTGGHIYPAIAIANALKASNSDVDILFVGAEGRMEMDKVPEAGYEIVGLPISGIQRRLTLENLKFPFKLIKSLWKAGELISSFKPNVVIGVGGYASGPIMWIAQNRKIPTVIQEQNGYAGLTNKILGGKAEKICVAYPNMEYYFPKRVIEFTGNPVRQDIVDLSSQKEEGYKQWGFSSDKPVLFVFGGSLGALTLNESMANGVDKLLEAGVQIIWQTGKYYHKRYHQKFGGREKEGLHVVAFIKEMEKVYAISNVVVGRSGALSISELCLAGLPTILVPSPNVAEDHQTKNAMALVNEGAAILVKDVDARAQLIDEVLALINDKEKQASLSQSILKLGKPNAANDIATQVINVAERHYKKFN
ncbi:undecaprenyldiphospho-muramoylpentapeptide beta-N-acetylglucosaminyltransferase [Flammeovirga yaeyamensis]|uniref:UDP-N-acetylglucosamine--N-acetylmuramyl-(pentapeptide) pyrophosphoryl-undecaprenol N-acetylglucosamine transferase n=1 Tax=Flammeovirga yaeyamensis TaxID=367791 RepID=A0AAX1N1D9_9BACT|nr:undecaprenyldiphospho-muramoylpentapeptide beta-N-acetylglucosaminyltransferase [Flammeovirga yaeyamensis]MBB3698460.1 UDP-N-acetylglucosamine--N-acetylmuramyl-(pentapeptide) pyrophosphoryl-undecaprenol N-acetylglucosamine transferase [Flammeovirga yaeyamensis]NMF34191.1 undecaprenyldiphospho-muramoylpentapeptide beta-N-acetylglucosaminyltransferase [Flammeovirga yaeyamensis]QWG01176.1 undecaprenyldiphospho-muramoylpentapeptide beta-N-acetylglucosaminyltransferase [Flammeovirga yaeyamensis]